MTLPVANAAGSERKLRVRQAIVISLLFGGYASLYFCRADLSVAAPLLAKELVRRGFSYDGALVRIGAITSLGILAYALGKPFVGGLGDYWGGRINFLIGLAGATVCTVLFALAGALPLFTTAWFLNRLTQSGAWAGLLKVSSRWFDYSSHGAIIGVLSLSYLIGDAGAREWMGRLIAHGYGWRSLFVLAAAVCGTMLIASFALLRESRVAVGYGDTMANPVNVFARSKAPPATIRERLGPLLRSPAFLMVCVLSLVCTIVRETFNDWTPVYMRDFVHLSMSEAAGMSAIFPGVGAISVLLTGWLGDRLGAHGRPLILFAGLSATAVTLFLLTLLHRGGADTGLPIALIGVVAFCLLGPYAYLGGAMALDFGGKAAGAVASGIIDGVGYLGAVFAGVGGAKIAVTFGWRGLFATLAVIGAVGAIGAGALYAMERRAVAARTMAAARISAAGVGS
ncbi:MAG TPA: MFS transporter [Steroidobacteraceae bacterium]|jgi:OPA family glycerol-3-phosphate transporter-like MFS transporter|nr:MFS transporter [Steroidobacteraceae bacterium]